MKDNNQPPNPNKNWDTFILIMKILAPLLLLSLLLFACGGEEEKKPHSTPQHTTRTGRPTNTNTNVMNASGNTTTKTQKTSKPRQDSLGKNTTTTVSSNSTSNTAGTSDNTANRTPSDYKSMRTVQMTEVLALMLEIRKDELRKSGLSDAEVDILIQGYHSIYDVTRTSPKLLMQMDHILAERNRALAQQLVIDYDVYRADSNLTTIVKMRDLTPKTTKSTTRASNSNKSTKTK
jgi:hypothetical protein